MTLTVVCSLVFIKIQMQLEDFHHVAIRKLAILVLVNRIECVPSLDCVYAALDWISMSLRRMLGA